MIVLGGWVKNESGQEGSNQAAEGLDVELAFLRWQVRLPFPLGL